MKTSDARRYYILNTFGITQAFEGAPWVAYRRSEPGGSVEASIANYDKIECICKARAWWGHFNYDDEMKAFSEIFPPQSRSDR